MEHIIRCLINLYHLFRYYRKPICDTDLTREGGRLGSILMSQFIESTWLFKNKRQFCIRCIGHFIYNVLIFPATLYKKSIQRLELFFCLFSFFFPSQIKVPFFSLPCLWFLPHPNFCFWVLTVKTSMILCL